MRRRRRRNAMRRKSRWSLQEEYLGDSGTTFGMRRRMTNIRVGRVMAS